jgi:hypothetical protein
MGIMDRVLNKFGYELYVTPVEDIKNSRGEQEFTKYPWIFRAHFRKSYDILKEIDEKLDREWIPYIQSSQNENGSFPWGYGKVEHEENVDRTVGVILPLSEYNDKRIGGIIKKGVNYLLKQQHLGKTRLNPWLKYQEDPGIAALVTTALAKLYNSNSPEVQEELKFIDSKISSDGKPKVLESYLMQNPLAASLYILNAYSAAGKKDSEKSIKVKDWVLRQQHKEGYFDIGRSWKIEFTSKQLSQYLYNIRSIITDDTKVELTSAFLYTFIKDLNYPLDSREISSAVNYISKRRLSRLTRSKAPSSILAHATTLLLAKPDRELSYGIISDIHKVINIPMGSNIEQDVGRIGWSILMRNILKK